MRRASSATNGIRNGPDGMQTPNKKRQTPPIAVTRINPRAIPAKPQRGIMRYARRTPPTERDAWNETRERYEKQVGPHQFARYERERRHRRQDSRASHRYGRGRPRERIPNMPGNKRIAGPTVTGAKAPKKKNRQKPYEWPIDLRRHRLKSRAEMRQNSIRIRMNSRRNRNDKARKRNNQLEVTHHQGNTTQRHTWGPKSSHQSLK